MKNEFAQWLERKYLEWQTKEGNRRTIGEFAEWLGFKQSIVSLWMNGDRNPGKESADRLAYKLGNDVYQLLGLPVDENRLIPIQANWDTMTDAQRNELADLAERFAREGRPPYQAGYIEAETGRAPATGEERGPAAQVEPRIVAKFTSSWRNLPPDLQQQTEELFSTITAEEFAEWLGEIIRRKLARGARHARGDDERDGEPNGHRPAKDEKRLSAHTP